MEKTTDEKQTPKGKNWKIVEYDHLKWIDIVTTDNMRIVSVDASENYEDALKDAQIIVSAGQTAAERDRLRAENAELRKALDNIGSVQSPASDERFYELNGGPVGVIHKMRNEALDALAKSEQAGR